MSTTERPYNDGISTAPKPSTPLPKLPLSAMEIVTYFPAHVQHPEVMFRLLRNGWIAPVIAKAQLHARGTLTKDELKRRHDSLRHQVGAAGRAKFGQTWSGINGAHKNDPALQPIKATDFTPPTHPLGVIEYYDVTDMMGTTFHGRPLAPVATLQELNNGVTVHPSGEDAGMLTKAIAWAANHEFKDVDDEEYTTEDIVDICSEEGYTLPDSADTDTWDREGAERAGAIVVS